MWKIPGVGCTRSDDRENNFQAFLYSLVGHGGCINDARFFIVSSLLPFKRQPESLLSPGIDPHGNGHFASPYGAAAYGGGGAGGVLGRQRSSGGGVAGAGAGAGAGGMYHSSPPRASFRYE